MSDDGNQMNGSRESRSKKRVYAHRAKHPHRRIIYNAAREIRAILDRLPAELRDRYFVRLSLGAVVEQLEHLTDEHRTTRPRLMVLGEEEADSSFLWKRPGLLTEFELHSPEICEALWRTAYVVDSIQLRLWRKRRSGTAPSRNQLMEGQKRWMERFDREAKLKPSE
jgi:hypothetical protein